MHPRACLLLGSLAATVATLWALLGLTAMSVPCPPWRENRRCYARIDSFSWCRTPDHLCHRSAGHGSHRIPPCRHSRAGPIPTTTTPLLVHIILPLPSNGCWQDQYVFVRRATSRLRHAPTLHRSVCAQYDLTPRRSIPSRFFYARRERWRFYTNGPRL